MKTIIVYKCRRNNMVAISEIRNFWTKVSQPRTKMNRNDQFQTFRSSPRIKKHDGNTSQRQYNIIFT